MSLRVIKIFQWVIVIVWSRMVPNPMYERDDGSLVLLGGMGTLGGRASGMLVHWRCALAASVGPQPLSLSLPRYPSYHDRL